MLMRRSFEQVVCAVVFCVLTFCYLYNYQADVLVVTQFLASGGQTHYAPFLGAVIITSVLLLLQVVVQFFARLRRRSYALTYAPSLLLLAWLTGIRSDVTTQVDFGSWWLAIPFLLLVIVPAIIQAMRYQPYEPDERRQGFLSQLLWINLGTLALMFLFVGFLSNNDREFHKRARMEYLVDQRRYREALVMAQRLERPDSVSSMLTIYSVARTGHLTDSLFHYRLVGEGKVMRPSPQVHSLLTPDSILNRVTSKSANYQLMGFLLDRDLPTFCAYLSRCLVIMLRHGSSTISCVQESVPSATRRVLIPIIICADEFDRWSYAGCFPAYGYQSIEEDGNPPFGGFMASVSLCSEW